VNLLLGPASIDRYLAASGDEQRDLPGGGALNMAYHWSRLGPPFRFLTRIGADDGEVVLEFLRRHSIEHLPGSITAPGVSASIDIVFRADRQPFMDHFVEGVWGGFRLTAEEEAAIAAANSLHGVLVDPVVAEVHRLGAQGALAHLPVSGDFLDFRHYGVERFATTMAHLAIGFVGWPGEPDDPVVHGLRDIAEQLDRLLVVTLGSRGVIVVEGRAGGHLHPVAAVPVAGTTVGCGDAFIAAFLAAHLTGAPLGTALDRARAAGALATTWMRPLPDDAYGLGTG
jgi:hypothetical protein